MKAKKRLLIAGISIVVFIFMIFTYKKYCEINKYEKLIMQSLERAISYTEKCAETKDMKYCMKIKQELEVLNDLYLKLYDIKKVESHFSRQISAVCAVLEFQKSDLKEIEYLKRGLELLQENIYCESYSMFNLFYNANTH